MVVSGCNDTHTIRSELILTPSVQQQKPKAREASFSHIPHQNHQKILPSWLGMMANTFNPSTGEAKQAALLSSRPGWSIKRVLGQLGLPREILSGKNSNKKSCLPFFSLLAVLLLGLSCHLPPQLSQKLPRTFPIACQSFLNIEPRGIQPSKAPQFLLESLCFQAGRNAHNVPTARLHDTQDIGYMFPNVDLLQSSLLYTGCLCHCSYCCLPQPSSCLPQTMELPDLLSLVLLSVASPRSHKDSHSNEAILQEVRETA